MFAVIPYEHGYRVLAFLEMLELHVVDVCVFGIGAAFELAFVNFGFAVDVQPVFAVGGYSEQVVVYIAGDIESLAETYPLA